MTPIIAPILLIILMTTPFSTSALTTFGKSNPQTQNHPPSIHPPTPGKREKKIYLRCYTKYLKIASLIFILRKFRSHTFRVYLADVTRYEVYEK